MSKLNVKPQVFLITGAASGIGARVKAEAVLESFDGRFYTVRVTVRDHTREIGRGTVGRAVVGIGKFVERMKRQ